MSNPAQKTVAKIDTYENHQMKRARQTDRSLESLGNYWESKHVQ